MLSFTPRIYAISIGLLTIEMRNIFVFFKKKYIHPKNDDDDDDDRQIHKSYETKEKKNTKYHH